MTGKLNSEEIEALRLIRRGADVYAYTLARTLRDLQKRGYVNVVKAMDPPADGAKQQPYFGAIPTVLGREVLNEFFAKRRKRALKKVVRGLNERHAGTGISFQQKKTLTDKTAKR